MSQASLKGEVHTLRIGRARGIGRLDLRELWEFRELLYFLARRDVAVRYKQTFIGVGWALIQPLALMLVFTLFFGRLAKIPSEGVPYALFAYTALVPWQVFSRALTESSTSLVTDQRLITRVYFPRLLIPTATVLASLVDFVIALVLLLIMSLFFGVVPGWRLLTLPFFTLLMIMTALGAGFWLSSLNVEFRDVTYTLPFLAQLWLFVTPVVYPSSLVPGVWRTLYGLNPMAGVIDGFRWAVLGVGDGPSPMLLVSVAISVTVFVSGAYWFKVRERTFVDAIGSGGR